MYLDRRSVSIFEELISNPNISSKDLEIKKRLSRRQIKYSLEKINNWLEENNYPKIKRLNNGRFIVDSVLMEVFPEQNIVLTENYIPSEDERVLLILFILLSQHDLSLFHFTHALKVSNVTVLNDMKKAQRKIDPYELKIVYSRTDGYQLEGDEWTQRNLLNDIAQEIGNLYGGLSLIQDFTMLQEEKINNVFLQLEKIEEMLRIKFTDEKFQILPYCIGIIFERVRRGNIIEFDYQIEYQELSDTKEYEATEQLVKGEENLPEIERLYITLQLLATNVFSGERLTAHEMPQLENALYETLNIFESHAFMELPNKTYLAKKLMLHLKPAYYRIKYNLTSSNRSIIKLDDAFISLDYIVKQSIAPLESFMNNKIPDNERLYLTLFIGGHLIDNKQMLPKRNIALVVCQNGVTVSKLLSNTLSDLFPEFDFYQTMSVREFKESSFLKATVVFSTVPIQTDSHLFIIKPLLTEDDKWQLRQRVMKRIYGVDSEWMDVNKLIGIIERSSTITNRAKLKEDLLQFLQPKLSNHSFLKKECNPNIADLITEEMITVVDRIRDWKEAIQLASVPLLNKGVISNQYVEAMIAAHDYYRPYMILGQSMAIPHAKREYGVNKLGMSLLIVRKGVLFSDQLNVHFVVVIAPADAYQHVKAIYQLTVLSSKEDVLRNMLANPTKAEVIRSLRTISEERTLYSERER